MQVAKTNVGTNKNEIIKQWPNCDEKHAEIYKHTSN